MEKTMKESTPMYFRRVDGKRFRVTNMNPGRVYVQAEYYNEQYGQWRDVASDNSRHLLTAYSRGNPGDVSDFGWRFDLENQRLGTLDAPQVTLVPYDPDELSL